MRRIETSIDIAAPPASVWDVLVDFDRYGAWNPFIRELQGEARVGARLKVTVQPDGGRAMSFRPTVRAVDRDRELRWLGHMFVPGLFDGEHSFRLEQTKAGCRFHHGERFSGLMVPMFGAMFPGIERGFIAMNQAMKQRVERSS